MEVIPFFFRGQSLQGSPVFQIVSDDDFRDYNKGFPAVQGNY
jgi:hypothetical protein